MSSLCQITKIPFCLPKTLPNKCIQEFKLGQAPANAVLFLCCNQQHEKLSILATSSSKGLQQHFCHMLSYPSGSP